MKKEKVTIKLLQRLFLVYSFTLFFATSCAADANSADCRIAGNNIEKPVTFSLILPGQFSGKNTFRMSTSDKEEVKSIEVLLFAPEGNYIETRMISESAISSIDNVKIFTVMIPEGTYSSIVVLANSNEFVINADLSASDNKDAALAKLNVTGSDKWITDNTSGSYMAIPMWGDLGSVTVNENTTSDTQSVPLSLNLTRMLAKVSVSLTAQTAIGNFNLESIRVYNYYDKGSVAPVSAHWNSGVTTAASVPLGTVKPVVTIPCTTLIYADAEITTTGISSMNEIYLFESDNNSQSDQTDRTCLVLGGTYTGNGKTYYYRVDFVDHSSATTKYTDILRNHHYKFNVIKIDGPGYNTPDKAFSAHPFNIEATVVVWNDTDIQNVSTDGQYMLGVSEMEYNLTMNAYSSTDKANQLTITTDHPDGWFITSIIDDITGSSAPWIGIVPEDMNGGATKKTITLHLSQNDSGFFRSAKILIKTGTITNIIQVNQREV